MTVSYQYVLSRVKYGRLLSLLIRWRGSIYKLIIPDLMVMMFLYYMVTIMFLFFMSSEQQDKFRSIVMVCQKQIDFIPLPLILGFYLGIILSRWWKQLMTLPWPDPVAVYVSSMVYGRGENGRLVRRTIMRYVNLTIILTMIKICPSVRRRFNNYQSLVDLGVMTTTEMNMFFYFENQLPKVNNYWIPIIWASNIVVRARKEGLIRDDSSSQTVLDAVNSTRLGCLLLLQMDFTSIPLVYTQAVTLAFYFYFIIAIFGYQSVEDLSAPYQPFQRYVPVILILEFISYICALKVAEVMIAPFGDDDEDIEMNWMIDRNIMVSYAIVDEMHQNHPELVKDAYWDVVFPDELPYREGMQREEMPMVSTQRMEDPQWNIMNIFRRRSIIRREILEELETSGEDNEEAVGNYGDYYDDIDEEIESRDSSSKLFEQLKKERMLKRKQRQLVRFAPLNMYTRPVVQTSPSFVTMQECSSMDDPNLKPSSEI